MSSCLADIDVWLALSHIGHVHSDLAVQWFDALETRVYFCRVTQMGLLRLLTNPRVMGVNVRNQREAWRVYDSFFQDPRVRFLEEPPAFDSAFRELTQNQSAAHRTWGDAYLGAMARATGFTVVSFDRVFRSIPGIDYQILGP